MTGSPSLFFESRGDRVLRVLRVGRGRLAGCRLLQHSAREAERVAGAPLPAIAHFSEEQSSELRDRIFDEFNTLAVVLRAPAATFIKAASASPDEEEPDAPLVRARAHVTSLCTHG